MISFVVLTLLAFHGASGVQLECSFFDRGRYGCETFDNFQESKEITTIKGNHISGYTSKNVKIFSLDKESESSYVPLSVCKKFPYLKDIEIMGKNVKEISREVFTSCENTVGTVQITGTKLFWLPENCFEFLPNLEILILSTNQLKYLPMNLLKRNSILNSFSAKNNKIEIIELTFSQSVATVNLNGNLCVDSFVLGYKRVKELNAEIAINCASSKQKLIANATEETEIANELANKNLTNRIKTLKIEIEEQKRLMEDLQNKYSQALNASNYLKNITQAQKLFVNELLVNITILNKLRIDNCLIFEETNLVESSTIDITTTEPAIVEYSTTIDPATADSTTIDPATAVSTTIDPTADSTIDPATVDSSALETSFVVLNDASFSTQGTDASTETSSEPTTKDDEFFVGKDEECKPKGCDDNFGLILILALIITFAVFAIITLIIFFLYKLSKSSSYYLKNEYYSY